MDKQFPASISSTVKFISVLCFIILGIATYSLFNSSALSFNYKLIVVALIWVIFAGCYILSPRVYTVDKFNLIASSRYQFAFSWLLKEISSARLLSNEEMALSFRIFGVGGLFGYYGIFYNRKFGWMIWYATQRKNYVLLELQNGKKVILTPDNPEEFIAALK